MHNWWVVEQNLLLNFYGPAGANESSPELNQAQLSSMVISRWRGGSWLVQMRARAVL